jgi:hypothetical protein
VPHHGFNSGIVVLDGAGPEASAEESAPLKPKRRLEWATPLPNWQVIQQVQKRRGDALGA